MNRPGCDTMRCGHVKLAAITVTALWLPAVGKTIILDARNSDRMAAIAEAAPRQSWAMHEQWTATFTNSALVLSEQRRLLIRFSLDKIPAGYRIVHAELILPVTKHHGTAPRLYLWRMLADWGRGVCYRYRVVRGDKKIKWTKPGASGNSSDRATRPTDIIRLTKPKEVIVNVTEDVELWYAGAAPNNGWLLTVEDPGVQVELRSPIWEGRGDWRLRITYEPQPIRKTPQTQRAASKK